MPCSRAIIKDPAKRKKLIILINPPYKEKITTTLDVYEPSRRAKLEWKKNVEIIPRPAKKFYATTGGGNQSFARTG